MNKELYIALQMACELRQVVTDKLEDGVPELGLQPGCFPLPPMDGESVDSALRRIFGDYIYTKIMSEREAAERPSPRYATFQPKGPQKEDFGHCRGEGDFGYRRGEGGHE